jgi:hypothetical protein
MQCQCPSCHSTAMYHHHAQSYQQPMMLPPAMQEGHHGQMHPGAYY